MLLTDIASNVRWLCLSEYVSLDQLTAQVWLRTQFTSVKGRHEWAPDHDAISSPDTAAEASRSTNSCFVCGN